jgi:hypothetical protein
MERKVFWNRPVTDALDRVSYTSKCGRYRIEKKQYASGRNGHFNTVAYKTYRVGQAVAIGENDTLVQAKDEAEYHHDRNWEPN